MAIPLAARNYIHIGAETESFLPEPQPSPRFDCDSTLWLYLIGQGHPTFKSAACHLQNTHIITFYNDPNFPPQKLLDLAIQTLVKATSRFESATEERITRHVQAYASALLLNEYASLAFFNSDLKLYEGFIDCKRSDELSELVQRHLHEKDFSLKETRIEITNVGLVKLKEAIKYSIDAAIRIQIRYNRVEIDISELMFLANFHVCVLKNHGKWVDFRWNDELGALVKEYLDPETYSIFSDIIQISSTGLDTLVKALYQERHASLSAPLNAQNLLKYAKPHRLEFDFLPNAISCKNFPRLEAFITTNLAPRHFKIKDGTIEISNIGLQALSQVIKEESARVAHPSSAIRVSFSPHSFCFQYEGFGKYELYVSKPEIPKKAGWELLTIASECGYEMTGFSITPSADGKRSWSIDDYAKAALPIDERKEQNCHIVTDTEGMKRFEELYQYILKNLNARNGI